MVCYRAKGPGELLWLPVHGHPDIELGIHERHRVSTIFRADIHLRFAKKRRKARTTT